MINNKVNANDKKKKFITVLGVFLSETKSGEEVLLVRDLIEKTGFKLPGGLVLLHGGPQKQRKREIHNLKKYVYAQTGFNTTVKEPINIQTCALYSLDGELIKVYRLIIGQIQPSPHWPKLLNSFKMRMVNTGKILRELSSADIDSQTKIILKDFLKKHPQRKKGLHDSHLILVRELPAIA